MNRCLPIIASCALIAFACLIVSVEANQKLTALRPTVVRRSFGVGGDGTIYAEPSLFGLPNYQADISGILKIDSTSNNIQGCNDYSSSLAPVNAHNETNPDAPQSIALVKRGGCSFAQKALKAQAAGASAIVVYSYDDSLPLPKMSGGDDTRNIQIPGAIITQTSGLTLFAAVQQWINVTTLVPNPGSPYFDGVWVSFAYSLVAPDDRVEFDLYTYPDEDDVQQFIMEFADVVAILANHAYFTPHYRVIDGRTHGCFTPGNDCKDPDNLPCGTQCSNCGRYCRLDPNGDLGTRPDGADQVTESAYAKCLWQSDAGQANPSLWWEYVNEHDINLACTRQNPYRGVDCSKDAMSLIGLSAAQIQGIESCAGSTGVQDDVDNALLQAEMDWASVWQPLTSPYLYVNNITYYGGYQCPAPAGPSTCGPLSMICQGYLANTAPAICGTVSTNGCPAGVSRDACGVCGGAAREGDPCEKKSSFPVGAVIAVVIVCCVLIGAGVYIYMRRQNNRMRDDIDSLLKQYLPLEGSNSTNGNSAASSRGGQNANLRLINNLEASDEATDL